MLVTLTTNDRLRYDRNAAILYFSGRRKVLSTSALNGGITQHLTSVYNHNDCIQAGKWCEMHGETMAEHQRHTAVAIGLDPNTATGLTTGANTDNTVIQKRQYEDFTVTAIVTAGVEVNAVRVGDEATLHENHGKVKLLNGTINIILVIDADLTDGCMTRALVTCTEAKTAALQELMVQSCYSCGLATGSGTDGVIIISNSDSGVKLSEAGGHYKLGEGIGKTVVRAVKEALYRQTGLCGGQQHDVFRRVERFGVTTQTVWKAYLKRTDNPVERQRFDDMMVKMSLDGSIVSLTSLYAHLIDQLRWGLLSSGEVLDTGEKLIALMDTHHNVDAEIPSEAYGGIEDVQNWMINRFISMVVSWVLAS